MKETEFSVWRKFVRTLQKNPFFHYSRRCIKIAILNCPNDGEFSYGNIISRRYPISYGFKIDLPRTIAYQEELLDMICNRNIPI